MDEPLDETYFRWLCAKVLIVTISNYYELLAILHRTQFNWVVPGDKNREEDGLELREDFFRTTYIKKDETWFNTPCSLLEMLIAFAQRASFQTDRPMRDWFWEFMTNLGLDEYRLVSRSDIAHIESILDVFNNREYLDTGHGGLFPLNYPEHDQREVEIWYQFCEYLDEQEI